MQAKSYTFLEIAGRKRHVENQIYIYISKVEREDRERKKEIEELIGETNGAEKNLQKTDLKHVKRGIKDANQADIQSAVGMIRKEITPPHSRCRNRWLSACRWRWLLTLSEHA